MSSPQRPIRKVMLLFPPMANAKIANNVAAIPVGVASLAAFLRDKVEVSVLDAVVEDHSRLVALNKHTVRYGMSFDAIAQRIEDEAPDLLGISCLFSSQFPFIREIAKRAKDLDPDMVIVTGGTHPSFLPEYALESTKLDYVIIGEGELPLMELINRHNSCRSVADMPAIAYRDNGDIKVNNEHWMIENLDDLPFPARDMFPVEKYFKIHLPMQGLTKSRRNLSVATSRGCPFRCTFCSSCFHWGNKLRLRSIESVLAEFEMLKDRFDIREIKFEDDNLTHDRERAKALFQGMIDRKLDFAWNTPNGVSVRNMDDELLDLMKRSGCYELTIAVESGDPYVLKHIIHKPINLDMVRKAAKLIKAHGIGTNAYFICGFPGESRENLMNTFKVLRELETDRHYLFMYTPLPGTPLAEKAIESGLLPKDYDYEVPESYFRPSISLSDVSAEELNRMWRREFWVNNLRLLVSNPWKFWNKYRMQLFSHPEFIIKFFRSFFQ